MVKRSGRKYSRILAALLAVVMILAVCPWVMLADETVTHGEWKIVNNGKASGEATFGSLGFVYHSPTTHIIANGNSGERYAIRSYNTNGAVSTSNGIVTVKDKSYCDFTAPADGTLIVYVGSAPTKTGYVSKTNKAGTQEAIGSFVPCGPDGVDDSEKGFKVTQEDKWAVLEIEAEKESVYYITVSGSKMSCYGAEFVPYTKVSGSITNTAAGSEQGNYEIKFIDDATGASSSVTSSGNSFETALKPGEYTVALAGSYAAKYAVTSDTRKLVVVKGEGTEAASQTAEIKLEDAIIYSVTGDIKGVESLPGDITLTFEPADSTSFANVSAEISGNAYSALLMAGTEYTLKMDGAYDYKLSEDVKVSGDTKDAQKKDITLTARDKYETEGGFLILGDEIGKYDKVTDVDFREITFTNVDDNYEYKGTVANGKYSASLRDGAYLASITDDKYSTSTHVVVSGGKTTRDLLLKDSTKKTAEYKDTLYVGKDKEFKYIQAAVDYAATMKRNSGERVTIKLDPGVYREQVVVEIPDITLESNGGNKDNTKITWYYGIGNKYYSCVNSLYDPYAAYDKFDKGDLIKYWGSAVITQASATAFRAKGITFENSFNKYLVDEEFEDGVEPNGRSDAGQHLRKENTVADSKAFTERAAAYVNYADKTEFLDCAFIGSQDTLYTCNVNFDSYYKNCYIEGQTDFIFGTGDVIFDGCELNFCGYSETKASAYLTANSNSPKYGLAEDGYIFRNCYITYNSTGRQVTPGSYGRMWGDSATVAFINTKLQDKDMILDASWTEMSGNKPTSDSVTLVEYNTTAGGEKVDLSKRVAGAKDELDESKYAPKAVFVDKGWTPAYYTPETDTVPEFKTNPAMISNGDINAPDPGNTLTVTYELGDEWAGNDASKIEWYALDSADAATLEAVRGGKLLDSTFVTKSIEFQIPMEAAGKYIAVVVTPITTNNKTGEAKFAVNKSERPISSNWSDPNNKKSIAPGSGINIYLAGDSTVKDYSALGMYNGGSILSAGSWGEYLGYFFDSDYVTVNNYANGGRSLRNFMNEGSLDTIIKNIKEGDYLLIQFGHNDCANGAKYYQERFVPLYTKEEAAESRNKSSNFSTVKPTESMMTATPENYTKQYGAKYYAWDCGATYKGFIQEYIDRALEKGAIPVVVTPVSRLYYDNGGKIKAHHDANMTDYNATLNYTTSNDAYVTACREVYEENKDKGVLLLDAFAITKKMYEDAYAACGSAANGTAVMDVDDKTHSNKTGGVIQAGYIAEYFKNSGLSVSKYVIQPKKVYGEEASGDYIFTIDKDGTFVGKDKNLAVNSYWTELGQELFDSLALSGQGEEDENGFVYGDVTGDKKLTATDAAAIFHKVNDPAFILPIEGMTDEWEKYVDVDGKDGIDEKDYTEVLRKVRNNKYKFAVKG